MFFNILDHLKEAPADDWTEQFIGMLDGKEAVKTKDIKPGAPNMPLTNFVTAMLGETMIVKEQSGESLSQYVNRLLSPGKPRLPQADDLWFFPDVDYDNGYLA